jgi:Phosphotransferase enzyme family
MSASIAIRDHGGWRVRDPRHPLYTKARVRWPRVRRPDVLIAEQLAAWGYVPHAVREVFPDPAPAAIASAVAGWCRERLGADPVSAGFFAASVGCVYGLRLADGRRVVVKVHPPRTSTRYLQTMQSVQRTLAGAGFPAPEPLAPPAPLARGTAVAETLLDDGGPADAHDPTIRRSLAASLARLVALCRPMSALDGLRANIMAIGPSELWPTPHDGRFDFAATATGAEWLDAIAARARRIRDRDVGAVVVGHTDWRAENMRFAPDGSVSAVYDWDSLAIQREPVLAGGVAHLFTADFRAADHAQVPTLEEALGFITDYEAARGARFDADEHVCARAALVYAMAYTARCEHSDALTDMGTAAVSAERATDPPPPGSARAFLAAHADTLLAGVRPQAASAGD